MTLLFTLFLACSGTTSVTLTPESAAGLADAIAASPGAADAALAEAGTDAATFEAWLFTVAEDPDLSRRYLAARKR